jgi:glucokinase
VTAPPGRRALGIDVGGSKIAACLVDVDRGTVIESVRVPTQPDRGGPVVLAECRELARSLGADGAEPSHRIPIGIGVCELVSPAGAVTSAVTLDWRDLDIAAAFGGPIVVESDVRAAAIAEARHGAGRDRSNFVFVTVGTGVSYCLMLGGVPYVGARGNALILGSPPVESTASGAALSRRAGVTSAEEVFERLDRVDVDRGNVVGDGARDLGRALAWLINALDPGLVVVGGGLGLRDDYRDAAVATMRSGIEAADSRQIAVVPAELGADAGAIGAALLAAERVRC